MNTCLPAVALAVFTIAGCSGAPPSRAVADSVPALHRAGVEASTAAFHQALRANDVETFMSYVAEDVFFMPPGEPPVRGRDAVRKWMAGFLAQYRTTSLTLAAAKSLSATAGQWGSEFEWALQPSAGGSAVVESRELHAGVETTERQEMAEFAREVYNSSVPRARRRLLRSELLPPSGRSRVTRLLR